MGTGLTVAASTWYHVFAIICSGTYDAYFDTSFTAANKPACTSTLRYIGSIKTDASSHILAFFQVGQKFVWATPPADLNASSLGSGSITLSTPPGINTFPTLSISATASAASTNSFSVISGLGVSTTGGKYDGTITGVGSVFTATGQITTTTSTSSQISFTTLNQGSSTVLTMWYINPKVAPNN
jgi:hypothetical protein